MRRLLLVLALTFFAGAAGADQPGIPDPDSSLVIPWDATGIAFVTPGTQSPADTVYILVRDKNGDPISGAEVLIDLSGCQGMCPCPDDGLSATTDDNGVARIRPSVGGCDRECLVTIWVDEIYLLRTYQGVVSTDWGGIGCDGLVSSIDFAFFADAFKNTQDGCADYNGDGAVSGADFVKFAVSFIFGDGCQR